MSRALTLYPYAVALGLTCLLGATPGHAQRVFDRPDMTTAASFNLRVAVDEGDKAWAIRAPRVAAFVRRYRPLVMGTQEGLGTQLEDLRKALPGYSYIGASRRGKTDDEHSAIFYDSRRSDLLTRGDFWLSATPDKAGSMLKGTNTPRMASWGRFRLKEADRTEFFVFNTHLALEPENSEAQARILVAQIGRIAPAGAEVIVTGDFNATPQSATWKILRDAGFTESRDLAGASFGPAFSFHNWQGVAAKREATLIDAIFVRSTGDKRPELLAGVIAPDTGQPVASDHFPVVLTNMGTVRAVAGQPSVAVKRVDANAPLSVGVRVRNDGGRGMANISLLVDKKTTETRWLPLEAGEGTTTTIQTTLAKPGKRRLSIGNGKPITVAVNRVPATMRTEQLGAPSYVIAGKEFTVDLTIANLGSERGAVDAALEIDGDRESPHAVTLNGGERHEVSYIVQLDTPGVRHISSGGRDVEIAALAPIDTPWQLTRGDDKRCTSKKRCPRKSKPATVTVPAGWEKSGYTADRAYGWYRTSVVVPEEWRGQTVRFVLGQIDDADESFLNGKKIGATGRMPGDSKGFQSKWNEVRSYDVPAELIRYGEANALAVRVYNESGSGGIHAGPIGMLPLSK